MSQNDAKECADLCEKLYKVICEANSKITPDALLRILVVLCISEGWDLEKIRKEVDKTIVYYFENAPMPNQIEEK